MISNKSAKSLHKSFRRENKEEVNINICLKNINKK